MFTKNGFTFIEVLLTTAISIIGASLLFYFVQNVRTHKSGVDESIVVKELLADNIVEAKGAKSEDLPTLSQCLVRVYTNKKEFVSETMVASNTCPEPSIQKNQIQIMWSICAASSITANFSTTTLKLPSDTMSLKKIVFHAWSYSDPRKEQLTQNQIVIFRR